MVTRVSAPEFDEAEGLSDWRFMLNRIVATFTAPTFSGGAALVGSIAAAADAADHHPDVTLRYPGVVHVVVSTHAAGGVTDLDLSLAVTISGLAVDAGCSSNPIAISIVEWAIDVIDINAVRPFWIAVLGYKDDGSGNLVDPNRLGPPVWFQQMDQPRPQRNRIHIDVNVPHDRAEQRVADAIAAGGVLVTDQHARSFWVLADAEGNEACVCTWLDRD